MMKYLCVLLYLASGYVDLNFGAVGSDLTIEYKDSDERSIYLNFENSTNSDIPIQVSRFCTGFGCEIEDSNSQVIDYPSRVARANSPPSGAKLKTGERISTEFNFDSLNLQPGLYALTCYWSQYQRVGSAVSDAYVKHLNLTVLENGHWVIESGPQTRTMNFGQKAISDMLSAPNLIPLKNSLTPTIANKAETNQIQHFEPTAREDKQTKFDYSVQLILIIIVVGALLYWSTKRFLSRNY